MSVTQNSTSVKMPGHQEGPTKCRAKVTHSSGKVSIFWGCAV